METRCRCIGVSQPKRTTIEVMAGAGHALHMSIKVQKSLVVHVSAAVQASERLDLRPSSCVQWGNRVSVGRAVEVEVATPQRLGGAWNVGSTGYGAGDFAVQVVERKERYTVPGHRVEKWIRDAAQEPRGGCLHPARQMYIISEMSHSRQLLVAVIMLINQSPSGPSNSAAPSG
jgi:hypothetical protein